MISIVQPTLAPRAKQQCAVADWLRHIAQDFLAVADFEGIPAERFFRRVTRFAGRENRLTEVLAAVLERAPGLAWRLACAWTDPAQERSAPGEVARETTSGVFAALDDLRLVSVSTQVRTASGKQVDLALRFGRSATPSIDDVLLWVEIKHGAPPHEGQLENYVRDLPGGVGGGAVVLLAPRTSLPLGDDIPDVVSQRSWQAVSRHIHEHTGNQADPVTRFLLQELHAYMQDENLADPDLLRPEHFVVMAYVDRRWVQGTHVTVVRGTEDADLVAPACPFSRK